jgi:hypothetical protein
VPDYVVRIKIKDVTEGDIRDLASRIMEAHGDAYDADRGDFTIEAARVEGANTFSVDLDEGGDE